MGARDAGNKPDEFGCVQSKKLLVSGFFRPPRRLKKAFKRNPMADLENRYADNVPGEFYVDDQCIDCDLCRETATANFTRNEDGGYSYVYKQPETAEERALCEEAMEGCPVEAIGCNGNEA